MYISRSHFMNHCPSFCFPKIVQGIIQSMESPWTMQHSFEYSPIKASRCSTDTFLLSSIHPKKQPNLRKLFPESIFLERTLENNSFEERTLGIRHDEIHDCNRSCMAGPRAYSSCTHGPFVPSSVPLATQPTFQSKHHWLQHDLSHLSRSIPLQRVSIRPRNIRRSNCGNLGSRRDSQLHPHRWSNSRWRILSSRPELRQRCYLQSDHLVHRKLPSL